MEIFAIGSIRYILIVCKPYLLMT